MGVTRSNKRPSVLPIGKRWSGRHAMVGYSLPLYDGNKIFKGLVPYELIEAPQFKKVIVDSVPVGLISLSR